MTKRTKKVPNPQIQAEGDINLFNQKPIPYVTHLASRDGVTIHLWMGDRFNDKELVKRAVSLSTYFHDVVDATYSDGSPTGYIFHSDIGGIGE